MQQQSFANRSLISRVRPTMQACFWHPLTLQTRLPSGNAVLTAFQLCCTQLACLFFHCCTKRGQAKQATQANLAAMVRNQTVGGSLLLATCYSCWNCEFVAFLSHLCKKKKKSLSQACNPQLFKHLQLIEMRKFYTLTQQPTCEKNVTLIIQRFADSA